MERIEHGSGDRFAHWPRARARALLAALIAVVIAAALVPIGAGGPAVATAGGGAVVAAPSARPRDADLALYDRVIARIGRGENYYVAAVAEQRAAHYPVRPGVAVRLPTLAYLDLWLGADGQLVAAGAVLLALLWAWWQRLGESAADRRYRRVGAALLLVGGSLGLNRNYFVLHELWAGLLLALALGLHRPGRKWHGALAAAALAVAIREQALPFVLLMAALALWRRDWREGGAWAALAAVFGAALVLHLHAVAGQVLPSDPPSPSWLALRGLSGWLSDVVLSSALRFLPHYVAGPLAVLMVLGWAGWSRSAGAYGTLLCLGYGAAFMIAGRPNNFYWGAVIAPTMFLGLAFAPRALASLWASARGGNGVA